jgi:signal transduction histidine kinase
MNRDVGEPSAEPAARDQLQNAFAGPVPAQRALDEQLREQRLLLIRIYSIGLAVVSAGWCLAYLYIMWRGTWPTPRSTLVNLHALVLVAAGVVSYRYCAQGRLRPATYLIVLPLAVVATVNLALIANAEGSGLVTYSIAVCVAALALEGREWLFLALGLALCAFFGGLLHSFPITPQMELPRWLQVGALLFAATLGLVYPTCIFWLFSNDLTASRAEAWQQARLATEAQSLMAERTAELELRKGQLEAKNHEMSDFLYVVSHDLRAPLINLEGFSRSLEESIKTLDQIMAARRANPSGNGTKDPWPELRTEIDESLAFIVRSSEKMDFLVKGLIELSRIDTRPQHPELVDLNRTVETIIDSLRYVINERGITVEIEPLPIVRGDSVRLNQVFGNLIDNAIKYMKPMGEAKIHIGRRTNGVGDLFFIRDTGMGIRDEDQSKIFRLFTRLNPSISSGEGLGLTAVKKIVERNGGRIWLESEIGGGSTFWFTWPQGDGLEVVDDDAYGGAHQNLAC